MKEQGIQGLQICGNSRSKSNITNEDREITLSTLFTDPHLFGYFRNTWSCSLAKCLTKGMGIPSTYNVYLMVWGVDLNCYMQKIVKKTTNRKLQEL